MIVVSNARRIAAFALIGFSAVVVASCGGGGSSSTPTATATATATATGSGGTSFQQQWTFTSTAATWTVGAGASGTGNGSNSYSGVTVASTWGANNATSAIAMTSQLATGSGDITAATPTFPLFGTAAVEDQNGNALTGYTLVIYMELSATPDTTFTQTPGITLTAAGVSGHTTCSLFSLNTQNGTTVYTWNQAVSGSVAGTTATFAPQALSGQGQTVEIGNVSTNKVSYIAFACK